MVRELNEYGTAYPRRNSRVRRTLDYWVKGKGATAPAMPLSLRQLSIIEGNAVKEPADREIRWKAGLKRNMQMETPKIGMQAHVREGKNATLGRKSTLSREPRPSHGVGCELSIGITHQPKKCFRTKCPPVYASGIRGAAYQVQ